MRVMDTLSYLMEGKIADEKSETASPILFHVTLIRDTGLSFPRLPHLGSKILFEDSGH